MLAGLPKAGRSFGPAKPPTLLLAVLRLPLAVFPLPWSLLTQTLSSLLVAYGFWIEPQSLQLTRQSFTSQKLKPGRPLRILHLGDLHVERLTTRERKLIGLIQATAPDLILFSGDILNYSFVDDRTAWADARAIFRELSAPLGVYAVTGSPPLDKEEVFSGIVEGLQIQWLRNEKVRIKHDGSCFNLVGISCSHKPFVDGPRLISTLAEGDECLTILLYHSPDLAPIAAEVGVDLQLSGHTHGGQVRLPIFGALYTSSLYGKRFESGRFQVGSLTLYVTRGVGMEGKGAPRIRFLCPPELTLWEISAPPS